MSAEPSAATSDDDREYTPDLQQCGRDHEFEGCRPLTATAAKLTSRRANVRTHAQRQRHLSVKKEEMALPPTSRLGPRHGIGAHEPAGAQIRPRLRLFCLVSEFFVLSQTLLAKNNSYSAQITHYSTVTDFAKLRGLSTSVPRAQAVWYASNCSGTTCRMGLSAP